MGKVDKLFTSTVIHFNKKGEAKVGMCPVCNRVDIGWMIGKVVPDHELKRRKCAGSGQKAIQGVLKVNIRINK